MSMSVSLVAAWPTCTTACTSTSHPPPPSLSSDLSPVQISPTKKPRIARSVSPLCDSAHYSTDRFQPLLNPLAHALLLPFLVVLATARRAGQWGNPPELYYKVLNITKDTSPQEIRTAYKSLVRQWHPDKHPPSSKTEAEARFKAITEAYEALLDQQENRSVFGACNVDGRSTKTEKAAAAASGGGGGGAPAMARAQSDKTGARSAPCKPARECKKVYSSTNIGGGGRRAFAEFSSYVVRKAPPLERKVECTLEELRSGCKKEVKYTRDVVTKNGLISKKEVTQTIRVKPGWKKGMKVAFDGMGDERPGCLPGDAVFTVSEKKHKVFKRQGNDLVLKAEVPLVSALTGWSFSFRLLGGEKMSCSFRDEVIRPGYEKVVRGEGMPVVGGEKGAWGDLRVKLDIIFPKNLTDEQRTGLAEILGSCA